MNKVYNRINWENYPSDATPLNEQNLNKIDVGLDMVDNRVINIDTTKATKEEVSPLIKEVSFDEGNGIFTITRKDNTKFTIDTKLEKIAINFDYDPLTQQISLTLIDGTIQYIDLSALITEYEFLDTDTVSFFVDGSGKVSAIVKDGSIQEKHLRPNYLAEIKVESAKADAAATYASTYASTASSKASEALTSATNAANSATTATQKATAAATSATNAANFASTATTKANEAAASATNAGNSAASASNSATTATNKANSTATSARQAATSATNADTYAKKSQSYAVGGTGTRENEDIDNAKYYKEEAEKFAEQAESSAAGGLKYGGTIAFEDLPTENITTGIMYNITNSFTTDERFIEGYGKSYPAGTNVARTASEKWDCLSGNFLMNLNTDGSSTDIFLIDKTFANVYNNLDKYQKNTITYIGNGCSFPSVDDDNNIITPNISHDTFIGVDTRIRKGGTSGIVSVGGQCDIGSHHVTEIGYACRASGEYDVCVGSICRTALTNGDNINDSGRNVLIGSLIGHSDISVNEAPVNTRGTVGIGYRARPHANYNTAIGYEAQTGGRTNSVNHDGGNVAIGYNSRCNYSENGATRYDGQYSIALGSLSRVLNGQSSIAIGSYATVGTGGTQVVDAIAIGSSAKVLDSQKSIAMGRESLVGGAGLTTTGNTAIGYKATAVGNSSTAIGSMASTSSSEPNTIRLGSSVISSLKSSVALTVTSDIRDKTDINPIRSGKACEFISKLQPFTYVANRRLDYANEELTEEEEEIYMKYGHKPYDKEAHERGDKKGERRRAGLSAQQTIEAMIKTFGSADVANIVDDNFHDLDPESIPEGVENQFTMAYQNLIPYLIASQQELISRFNKIEKENKELHEQIKMSENRT